MLVKIAAGKVSDTKDLVVMPGGSHLGAGADADVTIYPPRRR